MDLQVLQTQQWLNRTYSHIASFPIVTMDGKTGQATFRSLIWALQYELHLSIIDGIFGNATLNALSQQYPTIQENSAAAPQNVIYILQGSLWCKGISPGGFTGIFGPNTASAIRWFQSDAGVTVDGIVRPYVLQAIMNTDSFSFSATDEVFDTYRHQVQKGLNQYYGAQIGLIAPNGIWERKSQTNLIKAAQIEWNASVDGKWGDDTLSKAPTISKNTAGYTNSKRILQWALTINGFYPGTADGVWGTATYNALYNLQSFLCLGADGICGKQSWASLLTSKGDKNRTANALDTSKQITEEVAHRLYQNGYRDIGRYLTNTPGGKLDKTLYQYELDILKAANLNVFPIYQTTGGEAAYFNAYQGIVDAYRAIKAAKSFGFPQSATIYFAIDYDVLVKDIESQILPYFRSVKRIMGSHFNVGVYGPRLICTRLYEADLTTTSFVSNMSSGFTCNIGQKMPDNWAYDQFHEISDAVSEYSGIGYDKIIASSRKTATVPSEFIIYESIDYSAANINFDKIRMLYEYAADYLSINSPTVYDINQLVVRYLGQSYKGTSWDLIAGVMDLHFNNYLTTVHNNETIDLAPANIFLYDEFYQYPIEITHFAATLGALLYAFPVLNNYIDAYAGWAGDLEQVGGYLGQTIEYGLSNYFNLDDLKKCIGFMDTELQDYIFKYVNSEGVLEESSNSGFEYQDMIQDVDAFNLYKGYSFATTPIYEILEQYYVVGRVYKRRFQIFEQNLKDEFNKNSIEEIALLVTKPEKELVQLLSDVFSSKFGSYDHDRYGALLAHAFAEKIQYYIQMEKNMIS